MNALNKFIGKWESIVLVENADGTTHRYRTSNEFKTLIGGEFVEDKAVADDGSSSHIGIWYYKKGG
ncbi:hypothetical protein OAB00_01690 [Akkermansiaceae bacterium]|nr:hypothetical protein [Akkermansiaceae bacterium]